MEKDQEITDPVDILEEIIDEDIMEQEYTRSEAFIACYGSFNNPSGTF